MIKSDRKVKSGGRYSQVVNRKPIFEEKNCYLYIFFNMNINQMKQSTNIRCTQHCLYFESHNKPLKRLHIIVCFSVLSNSSAFTISTYFINECMYLDEISRKQ